MTSNLTILKKNILIVSYKLRILRRKKSHIYLSLFFSSQKQASIQFVQM